MVKVGFITYPRDQNPPRLIEVKEGDDIEEEIKKYSNIYFYMLQKKIFGQN